MNNLKQLLLVALALYVPAAHAIKHNEDGITEVRINRHRGNMPKQPTGNKLSRELVAAMSIARDASRSPMRAVPATLTTQKNARVINAAEAGNVTVFAVQAHGVLDLTGLGAYDTGSQEDVPVLVALRNGTAVWATSGQPATIVEHVAICATEDGCVAITLWVRGTNDNALYTFGDQTLVTPESDVDGVIVLVKVDGKTGKTLDMEAYPIVLPEPMFTH